MISSGETEEAVSLSSEILVRARSTEERDNLVEARVRMERALIGAGRGGGVGGRGGAREGMNGDSDTGR